MIMKRIIYILLCVLICIMMVLGSFGFGASTTVEAATGSTTLFNGFNSSSELQKIGAISLAGSSTLSLDTTNK